MTEAAAVNDPADTTAVAALTPPQTRHARAAFLVGLCWMGLVALALHFHERADDAAVFWPIVFALGGVTPLFWVEALVQSLRKSANRRQLLWAALLPALRLGVRDPVNNTRIWLPGLGWRTVTPRLEKDVDQALSGPMLVISLLVLPVILIEYFFADHMEADLRLARSTQVATALIWWAFSVEFVLMVSITEKRVAYCRKHWLDLAIILLPLLSFLRALRLGRLLRLQSLGKTARMYKLRGVAMRTYRALLLVEAVRRLIHGSPERRLARLRQSLVDHEAHAQQLRAEIAELEAQVAASAPPDAIVA
ncbi:MAG: hypothetical protein SFV23_19360 [Planctomycetaceae bacterium]|nr:hypothetical protein [Planctomycetaceae bacterium]